MNSITVAGILGKDAELKQVGQDSVLAFSVSDSQGREKPTIWHSCQLWGKRAATLQQYMTKGQKVTVTGSLQMREYTDKNGDKKTAMDVRVNDVALQGGGEQQARQAAPAKQAPARQAPAPSGFDDFPDSEPF